LNQDVTKHNFLKWYSDIRPQSITKENCIAAFKATGIQPLDPTVITLDQTAPSLVTSTKASGVFDYPSSWVDIRDALRASKLSSAESSTQDSCKEQVELTTATQTATHITRLVKDTEYSYLANPEDPSFSSTMPAPGVFVSPQHHKHPSHPSYYKTIDPNLLNSPTGLRKRLQAANDWIEYSSKKIDSLEVNLFVMHQYATSINYQLNFKENKPKKESERLFANGQRHLTSDEYIAAREREETEKVAAETLEKEYKAWRTNEQRNRKEENERVEREWAVYRKPFQEAKKRPPLKKPEMKKREATPERFWSIRKKRKTTEEVVLTGDDESGDEE
jgi:hypothetical protein